MWPNSQFPVDLVVFTEEILSEKLLFVKYKISFSIGWASKMFLPKPQTKRKYNFLDN